MTANAEARAMLDQLMGGDRDAMLPSGAALPQSNRKRGAGGGGDLLLPGKRHKSCYDRDICPLYCAWGVDVYELFVNTKSDIGPNPYTSDEAARQEFVGLPQHERDRMGFEHMLFVKLSELVQQCDRTVHRNHEKLNKELQRQFQKRGGQDYVQDIDEGAIDQLCRNQVIVEELTQQVDAALAKLRDIKLPEEELKRKLEEQSKADKLSMKKEETDAEENSGPVDDGDEKKEESAKSEGIKQENGERVKEEESDDASPVKQESEEIMDSTATDEAKDMEQDGKENEGGEHKDDTAPSAPLPSAHSLELGKLTLEKQAILWDLARKLGQIGPLQESVETQSRNLSHVKSDITTDKTVCEVSGNFMSARDADERIAAHYAGKQYVGWKLVREKFKEMLSKYGKYGPPPPGRGGPPPGGGMMMQGRGGRGGGGGFHRGGGPNFQGGGRGPPRGGGGGRRSPSPQRWERGRGGGNDRGNDNRGGFDRGRRDSDNRGGNRGGGGGGGGWGRR
jgi:hypothetical protein